MVPVSATAAAVSDFVSIAICAAIITLAVTICISMKTTVIARVNLPLLVTLPVSRAIVTIMALNRLIVALAKGPR
jgi:mannose/fructose-specific phosphotransferase system component IIA